MPTPIQTQSQKPASTNRFLSALRRLGSLLPRRSESEPPSRVVRPWREDASRSYPSIGLTPSRMMAMLQAADAGSPQQQFELFSEMLQKWPRLAAVEATRRLALTGLDWEVEPGITPEGDAAAQEQARAAADYCRYVLRSLNGFEESLSHLAHAIGFGIAAVELVWERGELIDAVPVPYGRLTCDVNEPWRLHVRTEDESTSGVALDAQPAKWIVHQPNAAPGRHFSGGLLRASALLYLAQNLSFKDWLIYSQIAGMPIRVGRFEPGTPDADKKQLLQMLQALGTDAVGIVSKSVELEVLETARSDKPYKPLQDYCNNEVTILWLGQHLTTDLQGQGSRAAAEIHDRVREDLLVNDIADESRTLRRALLTPLVRARFGDGVAVPHLRRSLIQATDTKVLADTLAVAIRDLGLDVPKRWVHRALGIPEPAADEPVLPTGGRS